jgi:hypothetical protein
VRNIGGCGHAVDRWRRSPSRRRCRRPAGSPWLGRRVVVSEGEGKELVRHPDTHGVAPIQRVCGVSRRVTLVKLWITAIPVVAQHIRSRFSAWCDVSHRIACVQCELRRYRQIAAGCGGGALSSHYGSGGAMRGSVGCRGSRFCFGVTVRSRDHTAEKPHTGHHTRCYLP